MKILAIDPGDRWVGTAISDPLGMFARPNKTIDARKLHAELKKILLEEGIKTVVVGLPKTLRGTESEQTVKVRTLVTDLKKNFPDIEWILWDERLTSQQASKIKKVKNKEDKLHSHSIAAALILGAYLDHLHFKKSVQ